MRTRPATLFDSDTDLYHFSPAINEWLIRMACGGDERAGPGNVDARERELRKQAEAFNPESLRLR